MIERLVISVEAYSAIEHDCIEHSATETGGLLVGRTVAAEAVVPFAVPGGPAAQRSVNGFAPDSSWQQTLLDFLHARFDLDYVGDYHRHPGAAERPSCHDWSTARQIVTAPEWDVREALFPIIILANGRARMQVFRMQQQDAEFRQIPFEIVEDADARVSALLLRGSGETRGRGNHGGETSSGGGGDTTGSIFRRITTCLRLRARDGGSYSDSER